MKRLITLILWLPVLASAEIPVTALKLDDLTLRPELSAPASVIARNKPALASEIEARIESIPVRVGDMVEAGTIVARLDCRLYRSRLAAAEATEKQLTAQHAFAKSQLRRAEELQTKRGISEETVEQRQSDLAALDAQLSAQREVRTQAAIQVERCEISSPVAAVVTERLADEGSLASPGTRLVQLVQVDDLEVSADLRQAESRHLTDAESIFFNHAGEKYPLSLRTILPVVDERTRTREARLIFSEKAAPAGAAGRLQWMGSQPVLPPHYFVRRGDLLGVFIANEGTARFIAAPNALEGQPAAIDLPGDSLVIVEGRQRLADGDGISIKVNDVIAPN